MAAPGWRGPRRVVPSTSTGRWNWNRDSQYAHERLAQAQQLTADEDKKLESLLDEARRTLNREGTPS